MGPHSSSSARLTFYESGSAGTQCSWVYLSSQSLSTDDRSPASLRISAASILPPYKLTEFANNTHLFPFPFEPFQSASPAMTLQHATIQHRLPASLHLEYLPAQSVRGLDQRCGGCAKHSVSPRSPSSSRHLEHLSPRAAHTLAASNAVLTAENLGCRSMLARGRSPSDAKAEALSNTISFGGLLAGNSRQLPFHRGESYSAKSHCSPSSRASCGINSTVFTLPLTPLQLAPSRPSPRLGTPRREPSAPSIRSVICIYSVTPNMPALTPHNPYSISQFHTVDLNLGCSARCCRYLLSALPTYPLGVTEAADVPALYTQSTFPSCGVIVVIPAGEQSMCPAAAQPTRPLTWHALLAYRIAELEDDIYDLDDMRGVLEDDIHTSQAHPAGRRGKIIG
ncbi:hypothetical protein C8F04DRAFT_1322652 [Mycena alexandri]|uniref:Uncharacterized protein n=1 Tax=Mycena alexandri TaxID=1745969 RepID=A0AAD6XF83_9AGAR|nr:hypothetical protein C8F04DRAFT_1322652 [Mycena alexandri]